MNLLRIIRAQGILLVLLLSACSGAAATSPTSTELAIVSQASSATIAHPTVSAISTATQVQAVATSRGPNLEATDPLTVSLASGQPLLVEFFRFT